MNYTLIINEIKAAGALVINLNTVSDNDIYDDWIKPDIKFSALNVYLQNVTRTDNTIQYSIVFQYGDRLLENGSNRNSIWDNGTNVILTVLDKLPDDLTYQVPLTFTPFEQQFADNLAGVYCTVIFETEYEIGHCGLYPSLSD